MDKFTFEMMLKELNEQCATASTKVEIENIINEVVGIDGGHPLYDSLLQKLCDKFGVADEGIIDEGVVLQLQKYIEEQLGLTIQPFKDNADTLLFAEAIFNRYSVIERLSMNELRKIAATTGFVVNMTSVKPLINIMKNYKPLNESEDFNNYDSYKMDEWILAQPTINIDILKQALRKFKGVDEFMTDANTYENTLYQLAEEYGIEDELN